MGKRRTGYKHSILLTVCQIQNRKKDKEQITSDIIKGSKGIFDGHLRNHVHLGDVLPLHQTVNLRR